MQNPIDSIGSLFLNQVREESKSTNNFSEMVLRKMSEMNFPNDRSNQNWNKVQGSDINDTVKNKAIPNTYFIIANKYFHISIIVINSKGKIMLLDDKSELNSFTPLPKDEYFYIYSKNKRHQNIYVDYVKQLQKQVVSQKIKNIRKGKQLF